MADRIAEAVEDGQSVLTIVGEAHVEGVKENRTRLATDGL